MTQLSSVPEQVAQTLEHGLHYLEVVLAIVVPEGHDDLQVPLYIKKPEAQVLQAVLVRQSSQGDSHLTHVLRGSG